MLYIEEHIGATNGTLDFLTGAEWFRKAAINGSATAQFNLGLLYARHTFTPQPGACSPYDGAVHWLRMAVTQNSAPARCALGLLYADGHIGVQNGIKNMTQAYELIKASAAQGHPSRHKMGE